MSATSTANKVTRSVALDKSVAASAGREAKAQNRSFSNYVETLIAEALKSKKKGEKAKA